MIPDTYHVQDGCWNCKHVFRNEDYDCGDSWYCNISKDRPKSTSVFLKEIKYNDLDSKKWKKLYYNWTEWSDNHEVRSFGKCSKWANIKKPNRIIKDKNCRTVIHI